jgi:hypothetical protein
MDFSKAIFSSNKIDYDFDRLCSLESKNIA